MKKKLIHFFLTNIIYLHSIRIYEEIKTHLNDLILILI